MSNWADPSTIAALGTAANLVIGGVVAKIYGQGKRQGEATDIFTGSVVETLEGIRSDVREIKNRLDDHISEHA
jgi:hypothetical protein